MNFSFYMDANEDNNNMVKNLILIHSFELFQKSYSKLINTGEIDQLNPIVKQDLIKLNEWWQEKRKNHLKFTFLDDQTSLIKLVKLREYL